MMQAIRAWAEANGGYEIPVIFANQNAPRPEREFITLQMLNASNSGDATIGDIDENGIAEIVTDKNVVVSVQTFGDNGGAIALNLFNSLHKQSVQESLSVAGVYFIRHINGINDLTALASTRYEPRYQMDILFRTADVFEDNIGRIETVTGTATINNIDIDYIAETQEY